MSQINNVTDCLCSDSQFIKVIFFQYTEFYLQMIKFVFVKQNNLTL
jgi:hypothetical protein